LGNIIFSPKPEAQKNLSAPKKVDVFKLGLAPQVSFQGKVEKSGVIKIVAQTGGIVNNINVSEGQQVYQGTNILSLSTNYQGGNALSLARQIAQDQYSNVKDTFQQQGDIIGKQKDLANKNHDNQVLLQQIASSSVIDTQGLLNLNRGVLDSLRAALATAPDNATKLSLQAQISQFQSAVNQTNSALQNLQVQTNQTSVDSTQQQHDVTVEQLDLQRKALDMSLDMSRLQYNLALVNEANMFPVSPFAGTVDRILVHVGDNVLSGTVLANISGATQHVKVVVSVPADIAKNMSAIEPSILQIGNEQVEMRPSYVSQDATNGTLYSVIYDLDDSLTPRLTDSTYVDVKIPIGMGDTINEDPFIPLDSVVQTQEEAFVYIVGNNNIAKVKKISLGQIQGRFVEVLSGLSSESQVILNRNVIEGDKVQVVR